MTSTEADARFLRRILMVLVAATLASGLLAGMQSVNAAPGWLPASAQN